MAGYRYVFVVIAGCAAIVASTVTGCGSGGHPTSPPPGAGNLGNQAPTFVPMATEPTPVPSSTAGHSPTFQPPAQAQATLGSPPEAGDFGNDPPTFATMPTGSFTPSSIPGVGTFQLADGVQPGTYQSLGSDSCHWARLSGLSGSLQDIIQLGNLPGPQTVTILPSDAAFTTEGCPTWNLVAPAGTP
jgi:hypothetical protein